MFICCMYLMYLSVYITNLILKLGKIIIHLEKNLILSLKIYNVNLIISAGKLCNFI